MRTRTKLTAALAIAGAVSALVAVPLASAQGSPIQHVVVIYMENHSFDNLLGYWCDQNPGRCPDGGMPSSVTLSNGAVVNPTVAPDTVPNVTHNVAAQLAAMNIQGGVPLMNGWQNVTGSQGNCAPPSYKCISGYTPAQIPNITTLAQDFAISDRTFSMADSPSWGGHLYAAMGSLDGFTGDNPAPAPGIKPGPGWGCDSNRLAMWAPPGGKVRKEPACVPDWSLGVNGGAFQATPVAAHKTIFDEMDSVNLPWRIYGAATPAPSSSNNGGYTWSICPSFAGCLYTSQRSNLVDRLQLFSDAAAGTLPALSIVTAGGNGGGDLASCHNGTSETACDNSIGQEVSAIQNGPDWNSTAVFITWDDFGGFYDQVAPGINPDLTQQGPREPLIIVSPYAKAGYTDTTSTSFAGILAYTEQNFGLGALSPNDANAYPYTSAFDYSQTPLQPVRMVKRALPPGAPRHLPRSAEDDPS